MVDAEAAILPEGAVAPPDDRPAADYIPGVEYEIVDSDAENEPDELDLQVCTEITQVCTEITQI